MRGFGGNILIAGGLTLVLWLIFITDDLFGLLDSCGVVPRSWLPNIFAMSCSPLVHQNAEHIALNSIPFFLLSLLVLSYGRSIFWSVTIGTTIVTDMGVWIFGADGIHYGASILIYGYFGFLLAGAFATRTLVAVTLATVTFIVFGALIFQIFPGTPGVSWEGHLFGFIGGVALAFCLAKRPANTLPEQKE